MAEVQANQENSSQKSDIRTHLTYLSEGFRKLGSMPGAWATEEFILRKGTLFKNPGNPEWVPMMEMKQCFRNAALLAYQRPGLKYAEGYIFRYMPILHGWCVDDEGNVIDPTIHDYDGDYLGVSFTLDEYFLETKKTNTASVLNTDYGINIDLMLRMDPTLAELDPHLLEWQKQAAERGANRKKPKK